MFGLNRYISSGSSPGKRKSREAYKDCNCCGVCALSCPVWHQTHDVTLTLKGRVGALKGGAGAEDLKESLMSCVLCGACSAVCPMGIDTVGMTIALRGMLYMKEGSPLVDCLSKDEGYCLENEFGPGVGREGFFLPGRNLRANSPMLERVKNCLKNEGISRAGDDGSDIGEAIEAGIYPPSERIKNFLDPLKGAKRLVIAEGIMHRHLREWLPDVKVTGLGIALLKREDIRSALRGTDLYIIETRGYNGDYDIMVGKYDTIRRETGCLMNLDLMRAAIPTGASGIQGRAGMGKVSFIEQVRWILEGRSFDRIVLENLDDMEPFKEVTGVPVLHVSELCPVEG